MEMNAAMRMCCKGLCVRESETFQCVEGWRKDMQNMRPKGWENVHLGHLTVDYKVSEVDSKWFLMNSAVKLVTIMKKI